MSERRDDNEGTDGFENFDNADKANKPDGSNDENGGLFSDEELEAALAGFEKEFADDPDGKSSNDNDAAGSNDLGVDGKAPDDGTRGSVSRGNAESQSNAEAGMSGTNTSEQTDRKITDELDQINFDEELEGLIGNRAKVAVLITRLISADLLAAFCQIADISADCVADENGAVAILHNLDGDAPEGAAKDLTSVVNGMPAVLSVNRADKLVSTLYMAGEPGQQFAPPVLFTTTPEFVEDLMLGIVDVKGLEEHGEHVVKTADFDRKKALDVIASHTRSRGRGKPSIE
ncbi:hypothetical protein OZX57_06235 [Bifidobacterium sp. ESL0682]|uniref:hypothetical protein n=1 Tax=Bifidobacterium sp. ESL0682 TaxID=2983212 RepID=UPI0023FA0D47|nr:hypothetical protein [Bifidobacterium sp. ESL0682]WEV41589.1 hypothetical protein OZX57_06235 [Bifidobacterium sp. ESL0682]